MTRSSLRIYGVIALSAAASIALAPRGSASPADGVHMTLIASNPKTSALFIPCAECLLQQTPAGAHIGGTEIDTGTLADPSGKAVGSFALQSVGVTPFGPDGPGELQLTATMVINGDQLVSQGLELPPLKAGVSAITGGTGRFRGARGELRYTDNPDNSTTLSITLNP